MDKRLQRLRAADRISAPTIIQALLPTMTQQRGDRLLGQDAALTLWAHCHWSPISCSGR
jgi:acetyl-CoA carboxylase carboxyl transferase subunit alpha